MLELAQSLCFDRADALAGDAERAADILEGLLSAVFQTVAHTHDLCLAFGECRKDLVELLLEHGIGSGLIGRGRLIVGDKITEVAVLLLADGRFQRNRILCDAHDLEHLFDRKLELARDFLGRSLLTGLVQDLAGDFLDLCDALDHNFLDDIQVQRKMKSNLCPRELHIDLNLEDLTDDNAIRLGRFLEEMKEDKRL